MRVFTGTAHPALGKKIVNFLGVEPGKVNIMRFKDGEIKVKIEENIRGRDVFIVQPTFPPGDNLLELLLFIDAARRASAERITAVIPYFGYARQDRKDEPRVPISAKLIADLITTAGADRVLTMDLHADQIQGFFNIPVDHLFSAPVMIDYFKKRIDLDNTVIVSPDAGGVKRARYFAKKLGNLPIAIVDKRRKAPNEVEVFFVIGEIKNKRCLIIDDIIDTGGTIIEVSKLLKDKGAYEIYVAATHGVFSGNAVKKLVETPWIEEIVVSDTIPAKGDQSKIKVLSISELLGEAIRRIHNSESVSSLFI